MKKRLLRTVYMLSFYTFLGFLIQVFMLNLLIAHPNNAQSVKSVKDVYVDVNIQDASIEEIFSVLESKTNFKFSYDKRHLEDGLKLSLKGKNKSMEEILLKISKKASLQFRQFNNDIDVKKFQLLNAKPEIDINIQGITITGNVVDENNEPLPGTTILVKGTSIGTSTDVNGNYSIEVPSGEDILVFSSIGYVSEEVTVGTKSVIDITLIPDITSLDEIIVVGYGTQKKENLTNAISTVDSEDLTRSTSTTTSGALAGKTPGVAVRVPDARPGRGAQIEVRNMGNPLFVIDGIPYGGQTGNDWVQSSNVSGMDMFNSLNMEDIESITILKDASAAIYGMRAANGVVLVTTKKGNKGEKSTININGYYGWQNITRFPELANAYLYNRGKVEIAQNEGRDPNEVLTPEELQKWKNGTEPGYQSYDYYDMVIRKNIPQHHINANISGGTDKTNYFLSIANTNQDALIKDFNYNRSNIQANLETQLTDKLTVGTQISARAEKTQDVGLPGGDGYFASILGVFSNIPTVGPYANDNPEYPNHTRDYARNPALFDRDIVGYKDNMYRNANMNLNAAYDIGFGLKASGNFSYNYSNNKFDGFQYTYDVYTYDEENDVYNATGGVGGRWRFQTEREVVSRYGRLQLDYAKTFGDHDLSLMVGYEQSDYEKDEMGVSSAPTNNYLPLIEYDKLTGLSDGWTYQAYAGYIGRINYNFDQRYILELIGRYDASYLYPPGKRWGFFPGGSIAWRVSNENFFQDLKDVIDNLKLRVSVGQTGLENGMGLFDYLGGYTWNNGNAVLNGDLVTGLRPRGLPVENLSWVKNTTYNVGIDATLLDHKVSVTADIFRVRRYGFPARKYDVLLPSEVGYALPNENLNVNGYNGAEGSLSYQNKFGSIDFRISGNITYSRFRNISSYKPRFSNSWNEYRTSSEDRWGGIWWGYQVEGRFKSEEEIRNYPVDIDGRNNTTLLPGDLIYKDVNGDGLINEMDERPIGYQTNWSPILAYGGNIGVSWNGLDLNIDLSGGAMQSWFQNYELRNPYHAGGNSPAYLLEDRWHQADPYDLESEWVEGYYPALRNGWTGPNSRNSTFWLHNVRYLRFRNVELGYTLPSEWASKINSDKVRIYANVSNLFILSNVNKFEIDPEISAPAAVVYPMQRTVVVGFNLNF